MKILLVHNKYKIAGGEEVVFDQELQLLRQAGHEVRVYTRSNFEADQYSGFRQLSLIRNIAWSRETKDHLGNLLREFAPDIVHVHNTFMMMSSSVFEACREAGIPVVQTLHNYRMYCPAANFVHRDGRVCEECTEHGLLRGVKYGCYRDSRIATASVALAITVQRKRKSFADLYIALSQFSRQKLISSGMPAERVCIKPNFVHPDPGQRTGSGDRAVFVGRLSSEKNPMILLQAWKQLDRSIPLSVVGDGPLLDTLRDQAKEWGLHSITFHGRLPRPEAVQMLKSATFLIAPSECYENFPMGIAEAFACGVPVICTRLGAMQEIVENKSTGLHFSLGDAADLADKVQWCWSHPQELVAMGQQARRVFEANYTAEKNYPMLMDIYRRVTGKETESAVTSLAV